MFAEARAPLPDVVQDEPQALLPVAAAGVPLPAAQGEPKERLVAYSAQRAESLRDEMRAGAQE